MWTLILICGGIASIIVLNKSLDKDAKKWAEGIKEERIRTERLKRQARRNRFLKSKRFINKTTRIYRR